jgi:hypothetical protein
VSVENERRWHQAVSSRPPRSARDRAPSTSLGRSVFETLMFPSGIQSQRWLLRKPSALRRGPWLLSGAGRHSGSPHGNNAPQRHCEPRRRLRRFRVMLSRFALVRIDSIVRLTSYAISLVFAPLSTSARSAASSAGVHGHEARRGRSVISLCPSITAAFLI